MRWFTPVNRGIWEGAASQSIERYGGGAFTGSIKCMLDVGWEKSFHAGVYSDNLIGTGKKVYWWVIITLAGSRLSGSASAGPTTR